MSSSLHAAACLPGVDIHGRCLQPDALHRPPLMPMVADDVDRARRTEFPIRHEFLAQMLGVHRPAVSTAASVLQRAGLISYKYGKLTILDPEGLAKGACECYRLIESQFDKIFDQPWREIAQGSLRSVGKD